MILKAENLIRTRMKGFRMDGKTPSFMHPIQMFEVLEEMNAETGNVLSEISMFEKLAVICLLHDVLEDTDTTYEELYEEFGFRVASSVEALTKKKEERFGTPELVEYFHRLQTNGGAFAQIVKCLDRIANLRDLSRFTEYRRQRYFFETKMFVIPVASQIPDPWGVWLLEKLHELSTVESEI